MKKCHLRRFASGVCVEARELSRPRGERTEIAGKQSWLSAILGGRSSFWPSEAVQDAEPEVLEVDHAPGTPQDGAERVVGDHSIRWANSRVGSSDGASVWPPTTRQSKGRSASAGPSISNKRTANNSFTWCAARRLAGRTPRSSLAIRNLTIFPATCCTGSNTAKLGQEVFAYPGGYMVMYPSRYATAFCSSLLGAEKHQLGRHEPRDNRAARAGGRVSEGVSTLDALWHRLETEREHCYFSRWNSNRRRPLSAGALKSSGIPLAAVAKSKHRHTVSRPSTTFSRPTAL